MAKPSNRPIPSRELIDGRCPGSSALDAPVTRGLAKRAWSEAKSALPRGDFETGDGASRARLVHTDGRRQRSLAAWSTRPRGPGGVNHRARHGGCSNADPVTTARGTGARPLKTEYVGYRHRLRHAFGRVTGLQSLVVRD